MAWRLCWVGNSYAQRQRNLRQQARAAAEKETGETQEVMCAPQIYSQMQQSGMKALSGSAGARLDQAQRSAMSTSGGGTYQGRTIMQGVPRNTDVQAIRRTTMLRV